MKKILYFAYGSNLNVEQMKQRCPDSAGISAAVLDNWKLVERTYADIEKSVGEQVYGAVYEISTRDLEELDFYEGYPEFYTRIPVTVTAADGVEYEVLVYTMTGKYKNIRNDVSYSAHYRETCSAGVEYWGIPNAFID